MAETMVVEASVSVPDSNSRTRTPTPSLDESRSGSCEIPVKVTNEDETVISYGVCFFDPKIRFPRKPRTPREEVMTDDEIPENERESFQVESYSDEEEAKTKKKKNLIPLFDLPQAFKDQIERLNGTNIKLVIQKRLEETDLTERHRRLSVPKNQVIQKDFLSMEEDERLADNKLPAMPCSLIQPCHQVLTGFKFNKWKMNKTFIYVLMTKWMQVVEDEKNELRKGSLVQLWSFRVGADLWFALVNCNKEEGMCVHRLD